MTTWWKNGPRRPPLGDKLVDWNTLVHVGGEEFIRGHDVLEIGPEYGLDAIMFAHQARRYVIIENADDVSAWIQHLQRSGVIGRKTELRFVDAITLPFGDREFDLVLDFGTFDNTSDPLSCYREACRVLRHHGILVTTYANAQVLGPLGEGEIRQDPDKLDQFLTDNGMWVRLRRNEKQARAAMIAQKGGEPHHGCEWYDTHVCTCPRT